MHHKITVVLQKTSQKHENHRNEIRKRNEKQTCRMSLCLWSVCMSAALREAVPGALVYSAILSFTAVSWWRCGTWLDRGMDRKGHQGNQEISGQVKDLHAMWHTRAANSLAFTHFGQQLFYLHWHGVKHPVLGGVVEQGGGVWPWGGEHRMGSN